MLHAVLFTFGLALQTTVGQFHFTNPLIQQGIFIEIPDKEEEVAEAVDNKEETEVCDDENGCEFGEPDTEEAVSEVSEEETVSEEISEEETAEAEETAAEETAEVTVSTEKATWTEDPLDPVSVYPTTTVNLRSLPSTDGEKVGQATITDVFTATAVVRTYNGNSCFFYKIGDSTFISGDYVSFEKTVAVTGNYVPQVIEGIEYYTCGNTVTLPSGGHNVSTENIGMKVIWVNKALLGTTNAKYTQATVDAVKKLQADSGLEATGVVDLATWLLLGYSEEEWYGLGTYITPLKVSKGASHAECVDAMMETAVEYMNAGTDYRIGCSGTPGTYADCSGFVFQLLYSIGVNPTINIVDHALAVKEYTSRDLCADDRLGLPVAYEDMEKGDIIFYSSNGYNVTHVAMYAGGGKMYDSNSGGVLKRNIWNRSTIVKIVRVCPDL